MNWIVDNQSGTYCCSGMSSANMISMISGNSDTTSTYAYSIENEGGDFGPTQVSRTADIEIITRRDCIS